MINTSFFLERFLQEYRFRKAKPYLIGDVLDFGGNEGELKKLVHGNYLVVNYDHSVMDTVHADSIISLAVIEHLYMNEVYEVFGKFKTILNNGGRIFLTTPTKRYHPLSKILILFRIADKANIEEHKHYWNEKELRDLAQKSGFILKKYKKFQLGFNQFAVMEHA